MGNHDGSPGVVGQIDLGIMSCRTLFEPDSDVTDIESSIDERKATWVQSDGTVGTLIQRGGIWQVDDSQLMSSVPLSWVWFCESDAGRSLSILGGTEPN